jgi:hypothetical protein
MNRIDIWRRSSSEHENLEFKVARNQFDFDKLCGYCVAIANEGGGVLLILRGTVASELIKLQGAGSSSKRFAWYVRYWLSAIDLLIIETMATGRATWR